VKAPSPVVGPGGGGPPGCFIAGTKVVTPAGLRPIESIEKGDKVLSFDTETSQTVASTVTKLKGKITERLLKVGFSNGIVLNVTPEHRFFDPITKNYRPIKTFKEGDKALLIGENGQTETVTLVAIESFSQKETRVYNFEVDNPLHNYLVEGILVHNLKCALDVCEAFCGDGVCQPEYLETCTGCSSDCHYPWDCQ
jgi:Fe2+ transport system protein FeoA